MVGPATAQSAIPARLVLCDDHPLARAGLLAMLSIFEDVQVVGEAAEGEEAIRLCQELKPDVVLMDLQMPGVDGLTATSEIKRLSPRTSVIILTGNPDPDSLFEAIKRGAAGYLPKAASARELITAIRQVVGGESLIDSELAAELLQRFAQEQAPAAKPSTQPLTPREREVLQLVAKGYTNAKIGEVLVINLGTVKTHMQNLIAKLGVSDRTQAAVRAIELGILAANSSPAAEGAPRAGQKPPPPRFR